MENDFTERKLRSRAKSVYEERLPKQSVAAIQKQEKNVSSISIVPGKRNRRLIATPHKNEDSVASSSKQLKSTTQEFVVPAKRGRRLFSTPLSASNKRVISSSAEKQEDALSKAIGLNCKLTNELLSVKNSLFQKSEELLKMQQKFYEKYIEYNTLVHLIETKDAEIMALKVSMEKLHAEQFCDDLINFEDSPAMDDGKCDFYMIYSFNKYL